MSDDLRTRKEALDQALAETPWAKKQARRAVIVGILVIVDLLTTFGFGFLLHSNAEQNVQLAAVVRSNAVLTRKLERTIQEVRANSQSLRAACLDFDVLLGVTETLWRPLLDQAKAHPEQMTAQQKASAVKFEQSLDDINSLKKRCEKGT